MSTSTVKTLFLKPSWKDVATDIGYYHTTRLVQRVQALGLNTAVLEKEEVRRAPVEAKVAELGAGALYLVGHGNPEVIAGQQNERIIDKDNVLKFDKLFVLGVSCSVAKDGLGAAFMQYIGWKEDIVFAASSDHSRDMPFFEMFHEGFIQLILGKNRNEVVAAMKAKGEELLPKVHLMDRQYMVWDIQNAVARGRGDPTATVVTVQGIKAVTVLLTSEDKQTSEWNTVLCPDGIFRANIVGLGSGKYKVGVRATSVDGGITNVVYPESAMVPELDKPEVKILEVKASKGRIEVAVEAKLLS